MLFALLFYAYKTCLIFFPLWSSFIYCNSVRPQFLINVINLLLRDIQNIIQGNFLIAPCIIISTYEKVFFDAKKLKDFKYYTFIPYLNISCTLSPLLRKLAFLFFYFNISLFFISTESKLVPIAVKGFDRLYCWDSHKIDSCKI